jgi:alpha-L-fucosidase
MFVRPGSTLFHPFLVSALLGGGAHLAAQTLASSDRETDPKVLQKLEWFQDMKFGLMMHWGPYSQWGVVESWSICSEDVNWITRSDTSYLRYCANYEKLPTTFNPKKFDPQRWAEAAHSAGMRYVVFTTKHHDGFCMFDTRQTSYRITDPSVPFHSDPRANVTEKIFTAFRAKGFGIGAYFSKPDWHSPYYWAPEWAHADRNVNYLISRHPEKWQKFVEYTHRQIEELMTEYGPIDILWLDGGWVRPRSEEEIRKELEEGVNNGYRPRYIQSQDINMPAIATMARTHQPGLIIVDRTVTGKYENYRTPEQEVPASPPEYYWETCMTMATSWSYVPNDTYKPARRLIHLLVDIVAKGGNFLLNVGPDPLGQLPDTALERMAEIGKWLEVNGEAIYGSRAIAPYKVDNICFTSLPGGRTNAIYLAPEEGSSPPPVIRVRGLLPKAGGTVRMLGARLPLQWRRSGDEAVVTVPEALRKSPPCRYAWTLTFER